MRVSARTLYATLIFALLAVIGSALSSRALAQDAPAITEAERVARDYMQHYSAVDIAQMQTFWAPDVVFEDPTAMGPDIGPDGLRFDNGEAAAAMLQEFVDQNNPIELGFVWDTVFESNGRVVFMGEVNALYPTQTEGQVFRWRAPQVTVITVRDGRVVRQVDYADYDNADRSILVR